MFDHQTSLFAKTFPRIDVNIDFAVIQSSLPNPVTIITAHQSHSDVCQEVTQKNKDQIFNCDALITKEPHCALIIKHADCQAGIIYDPIHNALALIHSGWRGSRQNIYAKTIQLLTKHYGTNPQDLLVTISPSLGPCHSEFINYKTELPESFLKYQVKPLYFDFWQISKDQLTAAGVRPEHIQLPTICTYCDHENFFSYRRNKTTSRNATLAYLIK